MSITINRTDEYVDYNVSAPSNRGYLTIDTSSWIDKPWMFYELPALKFEIYTETDGELVKYQNFSREIRTYNPVYSPLGVLNVTIDIRNVPEEFILRITPIFDNDAVAARNMLIENGIEDGEVWGSDQDVPTQEFTLDIEFIECEGEYVPPTPQTHEETITGVPPITFDGSTGEPLVSWTILGNGSQTGTPTPDNPIQPEFVGTKTANHFDYKTAYASYINADGDVAATILGTISNSLADFVGQTVTIRVYCKTVTATRVYVQAKINGATKASNDIYRGNTGYMTLTVTPETSDDFWVISYGSLGTGNNVYSEFMLNLGSTALQYEPYGYKIPISCAGQTVPVYLGQTQTVRRVSRKVFNGTEPWSKAGSGVSTFYYTNVQTPLQNSSALCSHFETALFASSTYIRIYDKGQAFQDTTEFKTYLQQQYANGTPVTVWYVLANEQTGIVNEPLCKIDTYADELHSTDAAVTIPTVKGQNTLTVDTDLQPSEMTITYVKEGQ